MFTHYSANNYFGVLCCIIHDFKLSPCCPLQEPYSTVSNMFVMVSSTVLWPIVLGHWLLKGGIDDLAIEQCIREILDF